MNGHQIDISYPFSGGSLDDILSDVTGESDIAGSVLYGGPFNADDSANQPFLLQEERWIEACLKADMPMLGICQAHFHTFDLPSGAVHLASRQTYHNQPFRIGKNVYGFQFHA